MKFYRRCTLARYHTLEFPSYHTPHRHIRVRQLPVCKAPPHRLRYEDRFFQSQQYLPCLDTSLFSDISPIAI